MSATSPIPALLAVAVAVATATACKRWVGASQVAGRFATIDGLRGYLAFLVFVHHACIWHYFAVGGSWALPPSALYTHFGQASVLLFFMITAFLFFNKLLEGRDRPIDWLRLYISRVLRLVPLYLVAITALLAVVAGLSGFALQEDAGRLARGVSRWMLFTVAGSPDLNGVEGTMLIVAGVTWSLPYEWLFYFALPLVALLVRSRTSPGYVALAVLGVMGMLAFWKPNFVYLLSFGGGVLASLAAGSDRLRAVARGRAGTILLSIALAFLLLAYPNSKGYAQVGLLTLVFVPIACGNGLFGILTNVHSRTLGEMAYGLYLLHGLLLFVVMRMVVGPSRVATWSPLVYWSVIIAITPLLVVLCALSFACIERPAMRRVGAVTAGVRRLTSGGAR